MGVRSWWRGVGLYAGEPTTAVRQFHDSGTRTANFSDRNPAAGYRQRERAERARVGKKAAVETADS